MPRRRETWLSTQAEAPPAKTWVTAHLRLAQIQLLLGDLAKAQVNYTAALNLAKAWEAAKPANLLRRQELASVFSGMADLEIRLGQVHESVANYRAALGVLRPLDAGAPEGTRETVGICYNSLGVALTGVGPLAAALDAYRSATKVREGLVEQYPSNVRYQRRLEVTYINIGLVLGSEEGLGDPATAAVYLTKGREIAERLANLDSSNKQARDDLAGVYQNIGRVRSGLNPAAAVDWFLRSVAITHELLDISPVSVDHRWSLGILERQVAEALGRTNRIPGGSFACTCIQRRPYQFDSVSAAQERFFAGLDEVVLRPCRSSASRARRRRGIA
jgi:tetratricopeptide (TPR) repeat protein